MTPERWKQIDKLAQSALERGADERAAFLDIACAGDDALRGEVESQIVYQQQASKFLEEPAFKHNAEDLGAQASLPALVRADPQTETEPMEGRTVSHYSILRKLGAGGMGEVYLAQDTALARKVAIKFLSQNSVASDQAKQRLVREAKAAGGLDHPHICAVYEVGEEAGYSFIVMQYVEGETLASRIQRKPIELREALDISVQIADALAEAHSHKIIHRDIKPQNVMLTPSGQVKVLDFGLARAVREGSVIDSIGETESLLSLPGSAIGTVPYMSPEQVRGESLDARSDIFSFGVVLYEMLSGRNPFEAESIGATMSSILTKEPAPLARYASNVPDELQRIVRKSLSKDKEARYQGIEDLLIDLRELKQNLEFEAKLGLTTSPESINRASVGRASGATAITASQAPIRTDNLSAAKPQSSAEYIVGEITRHKVKAAIAVAVVVAAAAVIYVYLSVPNSKAAINSIAVLPFVNESGNAEVEYLSDGMSESLINSLSQLPNLSVKARSSVFRYKGKEVESPRVASELSVQAVLNGRFVLRGDDLALYLALVDGRTGNQIWGEQYNRKLKDLVTLQSEIARDVSQKLRARLSGTDEQKLAKTYTASPEAYQLYLRGRYHVLKLTWSEIQTGILYFQQAISIDPSYALAYAGLADAYRSALISDQRPAEFFPKAKAAAQKAIDIDDTIADAHAELGFIIFWYDWDWNGAENQLKRALELDPNNADAHLFYAHLLSNMARHEEALVQAKHARELEPLNLRTSALEGQFLIHAGRIDEALARLQKTIEMEPNFGFAHLFASSAYIEKRMFDEAIGEARKAADLSGVKFQSVGFLGYALAKSSKTAEARAELQELLKRSTERYVPPYDIAMVYNGLDEPAEALAWLERGFRDRDAKLVFLKVEPKWNNLRGDPRFTDLMRRVGFTQ